MNGYRLDLVVKFLVVHIKMPKLNVNMLALVFLFKDIEKIKEIVIDDYHFSEDDSNDDHWVFIKDEKMKYIKK